MTDQEKMMEIHRRQLDETLRIARRQHGGVGIHPGLVTTTGVIFGALLAVAGILLGHWLC